MSRVLDHGEGGELLILALPALLLAGIGVRSGDWLTVGAVAAVVVGFAAAVLWLWWSNREQRSSPRAAAEPLAIEAPKPVAPLSAGVFVVDAVPAETGGA